MMKKELRKMKVVENKEEPFKKENRTYFVRDENNRSRYDDWRKDLSSRGYVRSDSYPNFFRTQSKNNYLRDSSKLGRQSMDYRGNSRPGYNQRGNSNQRLGSNIRMNSNARPGSNTRQGGSNNNNIRLGSKSQERPKLNCLKK